MGTPVRDSHQEYGIRGKGETEGKVIQTRRASPATPTFLPSPARHPPLQHITHVAAVARPAGGAPPFHLQIL
ncbi:MAG: hypothetical protein ABI988_08515, partial [Nitrospirota bacterium]